MRRHDGHVETRVDQAAQDVALGAEVVGNDLELGIGRFLDQERIGGRVALGPRVGLGAAHDLGQILAVGGGLRARFGDQGRVVRVGRRDDAAQRTLLAHDARDGARVDAFDGDDVLFLEPLVQRLVGAVARGNGAQLADHEGLGPGATGLGVLFGDAVVADHGVGHQHDLAGIGRIRQDLVVARHRGVEDEVTALLAGRADAASFEHVPGFQGQPCFAVTHDSPGGGSYSGRRWRPRSMAEIIARPHPWTWVGIRLIWAAAKPAPNPLSTFTTVTPEAQLFSIPKSAATPPNEAP